MHRQCHDRIRENGGLCHSDNTKTISRSVWNLCFDFDADTVSTSDEWTLSVFHGRSAVQGTYIPIADQFPVLGAPLNVRTTAIFGGMDMMTQAIELERRPHVVVATPGRVVDHLRSTSGDWSLRRVQFLVCSSYSSRRGLLTGT